jgi:hypothetical protein
LLDHNRSAESGHRDARSALIGSKHHFLFK